MSIATWIDEEAQAYFAHRATDSYDVFDIEEAMQNLTREADWEFDLEAQDILGAEFVYVSWETLNKERWPEDEVKEHPFPECYAVGVIDLEQVAQERAEAGA